MSIEYRQAIETPIGKMTICSDGNAITALRFGANGENDGHRLLDQAQMELEEYFAGRRRRFSVPLSIEGTAFQQAVWRALDAIPYGEVRSYAQLAEEVGSPKAFRAVGMANHVNPLPIFLPCHRVVGKNGKLTGYAGGLEAKQYLLDLEKQHVEI